MQTCTCLIISESYDCRVNCIPCFNNTENTSLAERDGRKAARAACRDFILLRITLAWQPGPPLIGQEAGSLASDWSTPVYRPGLAALAATENGLQR